MRIIHLTDDKELALFNFTGPEKVLMAFVQFNFSAYYLY